MKIAAFLAGGLLALSPLAANAQTIYTGSDDGAAVGGVFTNSNAAFAAFFGGALPYSPLITNGFETLPVGFQNSYSLLDATLTVNATNYGAGYSGVNNTTFGNLYGFDVGNGSGKWLGFPDGSVTLTVAGETHAFGFYATGVQSTFGTTFTVNYISGASHTFNVPVNANGGVSFFGLVDPTAFTSITISRPGGDAWGIDNLSYGFPQPITQSPTPEPAAWGMLIGGFGLAGMTLRRRGKVAVRFA